MLTSLVRSVLTVLAVPAGAAAGIGGMAYVFGEIPMRTAIAVVVPAVVLLLAANAYDRWEEQAKSEQKEEPSRLEDGPPLSGGNSV